MPTPHAGARPERPPWAPIIEQIERALAGWLKRTVVPPVSSVVPHSPPAVSENTDFAQRLVQIEAALENAGGQSRETDAALEEVVAELAQWRERAAALGTVADAGPGSIS